VQLTPATGALGRSLRHKLGTALVLQGDVEGAVARFEEVVKMAPPGWDDAASAKANYSLGVILAGSGQKNEAIQRLNTAVKYNPNYTDAWMALRATTRRTRRPE